MSIIFYKMPGCGWCDKAENLLSSQISSGEIIVKSYKEAPRDASGFPYFMYGNKSFAGCPQSPEHLYEKLGYKVEKYVNVSMSSKRHKYSTLKNVWGVQGPYNI